MNIYQFLFSPTGGTRRAAEALCGGWPCGAEIVDLADGGGAAGLSLTAEDVCLAAVPSFGGRVPGAAAERLAALEGNGARAVLLCAYGNRAYDDTLLELSDVLTRAGFRCVAAVAAVAQHSILPQFAAGRPSAEDCRELEAFGRTVCAAVEAGAEKAPALPGDRPYRSYGGVPMKPRAGGRCNRCGLCAAGCPVGAIDQEDPRKTDPELCISCMRCVALCPRGARRVSGVLKLAAGRKLKQACAAPKENELFL